MNQNQRYIFICNVFCYKMAKTSLHERALELRKSGQSLGQISDLLHVSKSTASKWTKDVILTIDQAEKLRQSSIKGKERGRLIASLNRKNERIQRQKEAIISGCSELNKLTRRELLVSGVALYAGEGVKAKREVRFCNSNPDIVNFMIRWLKECFEIDDNRLRCAVGINEVHRNREEVVKNYWSQITKIPLSSFHKTSFKKVVSKKVYKNFNNHFGTLDVRVLRSTSIHDKILGLIHGLFMAGCRPASRDLS